MKIKFDKLEVGQIVADMHGHTTNSGVLKGWNNLTESFEITSDMFYAMLAKISSLSGHLIQNKYAYMISAVEDFEGNASSVLVVYRYDATYHGTVLCDPDWDKTLTNLN